MYKNIIREIIHQINNKPFAKLWGNYYMIIHYCIMLLCGIILLIDSNIFHLAIILNIIMLDALSIVVCHNCPLTILEKKYLKRSIVTDHKKNLQNMDICFRCDHVYESTFEFLVNMASLNILKIAALIMLKLIPTFM
jgi:hypothetical protein